jgi:hypothetical protein
MVGRQHDQQRIRIVPRDPDGCEPHGHGGVAARRLGEDTGGRQTRRASDRGHLFPRAHHPDLIPAGDPTRPRQSRREQGASPDELEEVLRALLTRRRPEALPRPTGQDDGMRAAAATGYAG